MPPLPDAQAEDKYEEAKKTVGISSSLFRLIVVKLDEGKRDLRSRLVLIAAFACQSGVGCVLVWVVLDISVRSPEKPGAVRCTWFPRY